MKSTQLNHLKLNPWQLVSIIEKRIKKLLEMNVVAFSSMFLEMTERDIMASEYRQGISSDKEEAQ
jgi:hypothetical protein